MQLFIALRLPDTVRKAVRKTLLHWESSVEKLVPEERWHLTLAWLGKSADGQDMAALLQDLSLPFLPTVTVTHMGRGEKPAQLWAYAAPTYPLQTLQKLVVERVQGSGLVWLQADFSRPFIPHIHVADFTDTAMPKMLPDEALQTTFVPTQAVLYASIRDGEAMYYKEQGVISLKA